MTLIAATQRPTQKAMGQGAVRSQMDIRICFRVRERKDVDLILGQGMLTAGWHAHTLNAPGKFLISAPEHDTPRRARAYLVTDDDVTGHGRPLRGHPPPARQHLTPRASRRVAAASAATLRQPSPDHRAARPDEPTQTNRSPETSSKTRTRSCDARCPPHQPKAFPSAT